MTEHKHAWVLRALADGAKLENFEVCLSPSGKWETLAGCAWINRPDVFEIRKKMTFININGYQVPEPIREEPEEGTTVYIADITFEAGFKVAWSGAGDDWDYLRYGIVHLASEAADLHIKALRSFTELTS